MPENVEEEEEKDDNDIADVQKSKFLISKTKVMIMFDKCLCRLCFRPEAPLKNTSTLIRLWKLAAEKNAW